MMLQNTIRFIVIITASLAACCSSMMEDPILNRGNLAAAYAKGSVILCQRLEREEDLTKIVLDLRTIFECSLSHEVCRKKELMYAIRRITKSEISAYTEWSECEYYVWKYVRGDEFYKKKTLLPYFSSSERHDLGLAYGKGSVHMY